MGTKKTPFGAGLQSLFNFGYRKYLISVTDVTLTSSVLYTLENTGNPEKWSLDHMSVKMEYDYFPCSPIVRPKCNGKHAQFGQA